MVDFDLLIKYFAGKADPEEAMRIEEWVQADQDHYAYFKSLHQSWLDAGDDIYNIPDIQKEWEEFNNKQNFAHSTLSKHLNPRKRWLTRIAGAAAIAGAVIAGYYIFNTDNQNTKTIIFAAQAKEDSTQLADGTIVKLPPSAELVYPVYFKENLREVTLVGNGFFQVAPDTARPFIVHLGEVHIKVLGTVFEIKREKGWINVHVNKGKVAFYNKTDTIIVSAGATGKYAKAEKKFKLEVQKPLTGSFHFENTPLIEVVGQLNQYFKVNIRLQNTALNNCHLSAGFDNQPLGHILKAITETFNLSYKIEPEHIDITGTECY